MPRKKTQKNSKDRALEPYKTREAKMVALWLSMPYTMHGMKTEKLKRRGYDVEDDDFLKVLGARTREELAKRVGVERKTIYTWEGTEWMEKMVADFSLKSNVLRFKKDIDYRFTLRTMKNGNAADIKVWYEIFCGYKSTDPNQAANAEAMLAMAESIKALANKR